MAKKLTPPELVITRFKDAGLSTRKLSLELGLSPYGVAKWKHRGHIPLTKGAESFTRILDVAKTHKVKLTQRELIEGGFA